MTEDHPVSRVQWVPLEKVIANDYNPNIVAPNEMKLLYHSIKNDGFTQPIVTYYDKERDQYIIVDGFHRYSVVKHYNDIRESTEGKVPVVVIDKPLTSRMASTIRHNRARGKHVVSGMANLIYKMLSLHVSDEQICRELGLTPEELIRIKHITGFSKLFEKTEYSHAWETTRQIQLRQEWLQQHPEDRKE